MILKINLVTIQKIIKNKKFFQNIVAIASNNVKIIFSKKLKIVKTMILDT